MTCATSACTEVLPGAAERLWAVHSLTAGDAFQLAAALPWCQKETKIMFFVTLDDRVRAAAHKEGFTVLSIESHDTVAYRPPAFISFTKLQSTNWLSGISLVILSRSFVNCTSRETPLSEMMPSSTKELIETS